MNKRKTVIISIRENCISIDEIPPEVDVVLKNYDVADMDKHKLCHDSDTGESYLLTVL